jgi:DNA-binding beta-propeller fold protein YncE
MKRLIVLLLSLTLVAVLGGCDLVGDSDEPVDDAPDYGEIDDVSFTEHVQPLLQEHFAELETEPGLRLDSWQRLFEGSENGAVVIPFDAEHSVLYQLATRDSLLSAAGGQPLSGEETAFLQRWIEAGAQNDAGEMPFAEARDLVYVCNQSAGVISVIAPSANVVARHIDLSDPDYGFVGEDASAEEIAALKPHHAAVDPGGENVYVSLIGADAVAKFSRERVLAGEDALMGTAPFESPGMLARHPSRDLLVAGHTKSLPNVPSTVAAIRPSDMTTLDVISTPFERPHGVALHPNGRYAYAASLTEDGLVSIDLDSENELTPVTYDERPRQQQYVHFGVAPGGEEMYLTSETEAQVLRFDLSDPAQPAPTEAIDVPEAPWHPVFAEDGQALYFGNKAANRVTILSRGETNGGTGLTSVGTIGGPGLAQPHGSALPGDGRYIYISNNNRQGGYTPRYPFDQGTEALPPVGTVVVIDTQAFEIVKVLEIEEYPTGMNARRPPDG